MTGADPRSVPICWSGIGVTMKPPIQQTGHNCGSAKHTGLAQAYTRDGEAHGILSITLWSPHHFDP
jgi:hypothetical protein